MVLLRRRQTAFTLVELLVVIAIIGILVALLLPAIQAAREAARRTQCQSNVKQFVLAILNYQSAFKVFPPAGRSYSWCRGVGDKETLDANGIVDLLPFIEEQGLYDQFKRKESFASIPLARNNLNGRPVGNAITNGNAALASRIIGVLRCPSDETDPLERLTGKLFGPAQDLRSSSTNYDFVVSDFDFSRCHNWKESNPATRRMFGENSDTSPGDVVDGLSKTFAVGETTGWHENGAAFAWSYRGWCMPGIDPGGESPGINLWHMPWIDPGWQSPPYDPVPGHVRTWWAPAASMHPGGCHFGMGDGSVTFILDTIEGSLLESSSTVGEGT